MRSSTAWSERPTVIHELLFAIAEAHSWEHNLPARTVLDLATCGAIVGKRPGLGRTRIRSARRRDALSGTSPSLLEVVATRIALGCRVTHRANRSGGLDSRHVT